MKIGEQGIDNLKPVSRRDEDIRFPGKRPHHAGVIRGGLQQAKRGGADGDHPPGLSVGGVDGVGGGGGNLPPFGMHLVVVGVVHLDRQEGPGPDMQGQPFDGGARRLHRLKKPRREMQPRRRCRDGAGNIGEQGLVVVLIFRVTTLFPLDVGRQRHNAVGIQHRH